MHARVMHARVMHARVMHARVMHARVMHARVMHARVMHARVMHARVMHARVMHARVMDARAMRGEGKPRGAHTWKGRDIHSFRFGSEPRSSLQAKTQNTFILFLEGLAQSLYTFLLPVPSQCSMEPLPFWF
jgi:hypothetical protein